jgi:hypothetical protein
MRVNPMGMSFVFMIDDVLPSRQPQHLAIFNGFGEVVGVDRIESRGDDFRPDDIKLDQNGGLFFSHKSMGILWNSIPVKPGLGFVNFAGQVKMLGTNTGRFDIDAAQSVHLVSWTFGTKTFGTNTVVSLGGQDLVLQKLSSPTYSLAWVRHLGGSGDETVASVLVKNSTVYLLGHFTGETRIGNQTFQSKGATDSFFTKFVIPAAATGFSNFESGFAPNPNLEPVVGDQALGSTDDVVPSE